MNTQHGGYHPHPQRPPIQIKPAVRPRWKTPVIVAGCLIAGFVFGAALPRTSSPAADASPDRAVTVTAPAPAAPAVAEPAPAEAPAGPLTTFGAGTWEVGVDIQPGRYKTTGPDESGLGCYYSRLETGDGSLGDIIDNNISQGPVTVTIQDTDGLFETSGCAGWVLQQ